MPRKAPGLVKGEDGWAFVSNMMFEPRRTSARWLSRQRSAPAYMMQSTGGEGLRSRRTSRYVDNAGYEAPTLPRRKTRLKP